MKEGICVGQLAFNLEQIAFCLHWLGRQEERLNVFTIKLIQYNSVHWLKNS